MTAGSHDQVHDYLRIRLSYEIDVLDVANGLARHAFTVVDTRKLQSWEHGHVPGAVHVPDIVTRGDLTDRLPLERSVVVYGWGPGCDGGTRAAAVLADLGYDVREMVGGFEYWCRTGLAFDTLDGTRRLSPDPLVTAERSGQLG